MGVGHRSRIQRPECGDATAHTELQSSRNVTQKSYPVQTDDVDAIRSYLSTSPNPQRLEDVIGEPVVATGILAGKRRRALDCTALADTVSRSDANTQLIAAIRRYGRDISDDKVSGQELLSPLPNDASALLAAVESETSDGDPTAGHAYGLLALAAGQDVEPGQDSDDTDGPWRTARKITRNQLISTVNSQASDTHKIREERPRRVLGILVIGLDTGMWLPPKLIRPPARTPWPRLAVASYWPRCTDQRRGRCGGFDLRVYIYADDAD